MRIIAGIICVVLGGLIRVLAYRRLGVNFTIPLKVPTTIETGGLYKYTRHPMYLGSLLMILGLSLIEPVVGILFMSLGVFIDRVGREETILNIKPEYKKYQEKTSMLLPWRKKKDA